MNTNYLLAFFIIVLPSLCYSNEICEELGGGKTKGHLWKIIDIPHNIYMNYNPSEPELYKFVKLDINNDGIDDKVGKFSGGSLNVPYLVILSKEQQQEFSSGYCGNGDAEEINVVTNQGINYIYVKIKKSYSHDCRTSKGKPVVGYLTKYIPNNLFGELYCEVKQP